MTKRLAERSARGTWPTMPLSALAAATALAVIVVLISAWSLGDAQAQQTTPATATATTTSASPVFGIMQGLVGLAVVIALILAAGWLMKKIGPRTRSSGAVQVVGGASVGPREKVVVVRFGGQTLLLGVAPGQVSLLHASEHHPDEASPAADPATPRFVDRLRAAREGS